MRIKIYFLLKILSHKVWQTLLVFQALLQITIYNMYIRCKVTLHILTVCQGQLSDYLYFHLFYFLNYRWKFQLARSMYWSRRVVQSMDLTWDDLSSFFLQRGNLCSCRCCSFNECMGKFTFLEWYVNEGTD